MPVMGHKGDWPWGYIGFEGSSQNAPWFILLMFKELKNKKIKNSHFSSSEVYVSIFQKKPHVSF